MYEWPKPGDRVKISLPFKSNVLMMIKHFRMPLREATIISWDESYAAWYVLADDGSTWYIINRYVDYLEEPNYEEGWNDY